MGKTKRKARQNGVHSRHQPAHPADEGRSHSDSPKVGPEPREERAYLTFAHSPHIGIPWIVHKKSSQTICPPGFRTRLISLAIRTLEGRMENGTEHGELEHHVKISSAKLILVALSTLTLSPVGASVQPRRPGHPSDQYQTRFSGVAPHSMNFRNQNPEPHPTSRILREPKGSQPKR